MNEDMRTLMRDPWIKWGVIVSLVFLATFLGMQTLSLIKEYQFIGESAPTTNRITISGKGEASAVPDIATFTFSVLEEAATVEKAQKNAADAINTVTEYLKGEGIDEKDIKTLSYNVSPRYELSRVVYGSTTGRYPYGARKLVGFEARQTVQVKVRDTKKAGKLLSGISSRGVSNISRLQFTIDEEDALKTEARKKAITNAREKAEQLAGDLGVRLVRVTSFSEYGRSSYPQFGYDGGGKDETVRYQGSIPSLPTGENKITSNVSITYEIR